MGRQGLRPVLPVRNGLLAWGHRTLVMAILNLTPDSFSDGGQVLSSPASELVSPMSSAGVGTPTNVSPGLWTGTPEKAAETTADDLQSV